MNKPIIRYCTYFNADYLIKGIAMIKSLTNQDNSAMVDVLCFDDVTKNILDKLSLNNVSTISLKEFEDPELLNVKHSRSNVEYYWTTTPTIPLFILKKHPETDIVVYLDADLFFFSSAKAIVKDMGKSSIFAVEHRYPKKLTNLNEISGRFNVAVNGFRNDKEGIKCLNYWRKQCLEWCYHIYEKGRMGDQLYLNEWPKLYKSLKISSNIGINVAPWNISNYRLTKSSSGPLVNNKPIVVYHFHQFEYFRSWYIEYAKGYYLDKDVIRYIYKPYIKATKEAIKLVKSVNRDLRLPILPPLSDRIKRTINFYVQKILNNIH